MESFSERPQDSIMSISSYTKLDTLSSRAPGLEAEYAREQRYRAC